jgi:hypothetical protein
MNSETVPLSIPGMVIPVVITPGQLAMVDEVGVDFLTAARELALAHFAPLIRDALEQAHAICFHPPVT